MGRTVAIGIQDFGKIREKNCFYIDKTDFVKALPLKERLC